MKQIFYFTKWKFQGAKLDDMLCVKAKTAIKTLFLKFRLIAGGSLSISFIKEAQILAIKLQAIRKAQGKRGLTLYLKSSSVALQQSLAGYRINNMTEVGPRISRTNSGLPRIIPRLHRSIMINRRPGAYFLMRYYLSIFYIYRSLVFPGKVKLETITKPGVYYDENRFGIHIENFLTLITKWLRMKPLDYLKLKVEIFPIFRSSPFSSNHAYLPFKTSKRNKRDRGTSLWSTHVLSLCETMRNLMSSNLYNLIIEFIQLLDFFELRDYFKYFKGVRVKDSGLSGPFIDWLNLRFKSRDSNSLIGKPLGKLSLKEEAAGKVRVFAMVDPITQWLLAPLHKFLFSLLRRLPMDGTFNQLRPIKRIMSFKKVKGLYSLDLSAATDRLPVRLQAHILDLLFKGSSNFGGKWAALLTNRSYRIYDKNYGLNDTLKYAVGQPMGALSSWAMLALTHHFIVQVAAWEVGFPVTKLFKDYAVLGDDLVIANHQVAKQYLRIIKHLGVECGLHKSILSRKGIGLEFAKSTFIDKQNVSPISLDELSVSLSDLASWAAFSNKYNLSWERQMRILGFGYLARRKSFRKLNHAMQLIRISQIAKVDFNTDVLKLRGKSPKDFDGIYLEIFKSKVLYPLFLRVFKLLHSYPNWLKNQLVKMNTDLHSEFYEFDRYDLRNSFDLVMGASHQVFPSKIQELIKSKLASGSLNKDDLGALFYFNFDERVFNWIWPHLGIKTFDEALQFYFTFNSEIGKLSLDAYGIDNDGKRLPQGKLPSQAILFRDWSLISHRIVSTYRASQEADRERS